MEQADVRSLETITKLARSSILYRHVASRMVATAGRRGGKLRWTRRDWSDFHVQHKLSRHPTLCNETHFDMPIATTLPQSNVTLRFPPRRLDADGNEAEESYQLLELPAEILKAVEKSNEVFP